MIPINDNSGNNDNDNNNNNNNDFFYYRNYCIRPSAFSLSV